MTNFKYDSFDIVEVAEKCGIYFHPIQRNDVELKALCPFCSDTKYHLGLNRQNDCGSIRRMLIASINTVKEKQK